MHSDLIDQEKQAAFTIMCGDHQVSMRMQKKQLVIDVEDKQTLLMYHKTIDQSYIDSQDKHFKVYFQSPQGVFHHIAENISQVTIKGNLLSFSFLSGAMKQVKEATIELSEIESNINRINRKIKDLKEVFSAQLFEKQNRIAALEQHKNKVQIDLQEIKDRLSREQNRNRELEQRLIKMEKANLTLIEKVKHIESKNQRFAALYSRFTLIHHHPSNSHYSMFTLTKMKDQIYQLTKKGQNGWYNFVNKFPANLPQIDKTIQKSIYSVKIIKATLNNFMIGFCTQRGLGVIGNYTSSEGVYYHCDNTAYIFQNGKQRQIATISKKGNIVQCTADFEKNKFIWSRQGNDFLQCDFPEPMRNKLIYISILLYFSGDSVEIFV